MEFQEIVMSRYAVKRFNGKKIPLDKFEAFLELIRYAPSSFNLQPWKIRIVEDLATKQALRTASWDQPQVTSCSHFLVFCADTDVFLLAERLGNQMKQNQVAEDKVHAYLSIVRRFLKNMNPDQTASWALRQVYLALGNAMNAAKALGFDSCPMEGIEPDRYRQILNLPVRLVVGAGLAVGYADDTPRPKLRFPKEDVFF